ncbi:DNA gyrase/topoisomerase IV subunit A [Muribaculum intestinale]|uniref:DNA gyrase/topoisomerase IV subunit A n=1 Tax=Muribaculum intestinale TaxID=1796646 RepID=UPI00242B1F25|nr:DNA gyrase/topoisomerase IV subunit A [Muribaculum intestinale]
MSDDITTPDDLNDPDFEDSPLEQSEDNSAPTGRVTLDTSDDVVRHQLRGMYQSWFLEYASYVILERAVPHIDDGLKPVQRRILHSMHTLDDGRFNKVANIVGNTMQYHPHGDASINDALVQLGQKDLLVETQGNWGNVLTGASAAAGRYIEARLSPFALEVLYNSKTTNWTVSYDGRKPEPVTLPAKFPLLLVQGVEGIAVGLSSKILPHNFNEIIDAAVSYLRDEPFALYPDFITGGSLDVSKYNDGERGGSVKIRAKIEKVDNKTLAITEIPFGKTTGTISDSIIKAAEKGKIKVRKVEDMTSENACILVHLLPGTSSDKAIDALYAFTDCELSVSPNCCVISGKKPHFLGVSDVLRHSVDTTRELLRRELEIQRGELMESLHFASLERIFIEERIYKDKQFEEGKDMDSVLAHIDKRLEPFKKNLWREVTRDDLLRLMEIKMKRILRFNSDEADRLIANYRERVADIDLKLANIIQHTIDWYLHLKEKYGDAYPRHTVLRSFDSIEAATVAEANERLYINREEGFIGTSLKKDEYVCQCSDIDDIIIFYKDGKYKVVKVQDKMFVGKGVLYVNVFKRNDLRTIYNVIYQNGKGGTYYMKRFAVTGVSRDKEYNLTQGLPGSKVAWFSANPNGEAEVVKVTLKPKLRLKTLQFDIDFSQLAIKGKQSQGNMVTKNEVHRFTLKEKGASTLGGRQVWFDPDVLRLNYDKRGIYMGEFNGTDQVLVILKSGEYYLSSFDAGNHYEDGILRIEKFRPGHVWTAVIDDADQGYPYLKRFTFEPASKRTRFIGENEKSSLILLSDAAGCRIKVIFGGTDAYREPLEVGAMDFIAVKSYKARGKRLTTYAVDKVEELEPREVEDVEEDETEAAIPDDESAPDSEEKSDDEVRDEINGQQRIF